MTAPNTERNELQRALNRLGYLIASDATSWEDARRLLAEAQRVHEGLSDAKLAEQPKRGHPTFEQRDPEKGRG